MKKILASSVSLFLILKAISIITVNATYVTCYREQVNVFDIHRNEIKKPTSEFIVTAIQPNGTARGFVTSSNIVKSELTAYTGDTLTFTDLSEAFGGSSISKYDLQIYGDGWRDVSIIDNLNSKTITLTKAETINIYLCVMSDQEVPPQGIAPWSANGSHRSIAYSEDFPNGIYWYFTHIQVEVLETLEPTPAPEPVVITPAEGTIKFDPEGSDWTNKPVTVRVYVDGDTSTQKTDLESRSYSYTTFETDQITGESSRNTFTSSTSWGFAQNWNIGNIRVTGDNLPNPNTITNNTTVTLTEDSIGELSASLTGWTSGTKSWDEGSPPSGSWSSSSPSSNTSEPTERYNSTSGTYKIDTTRPTITYNNTGRNRFADGWNGYYYHHDNSISFTISDNLSGISRVVYRWHREGDSGTSVEMDITTPEGRETQRTIQIPVHSEKIRTGDWYLNVYAQDRAGNSFTLSNNRIRIICELYNFRITGIEDPSWRTFFHNSDGTSKGVELKVSDFPVGNRPDIRNTHIKKGYAFFFRFNSRGLNSLAGDVDRVEIKPRFYHTYDPSTGSDKRIDLYYNMGSTYLIKAGSNRDSLEIVYNNDKLGSLTLLDNFPMEATDQIEGEWRGAYFIPSESITVVRDKEPHIESNRLKGGYIIVEFVIEGIKNDQVVFKYVDRDITTDKWDEEGGVNAQNSEFFKGDIIIIDNRYSKRDDYKVQVDR
ncbi:UNVERIFIED_CONTAM: hypothetical protein Cloal_1444 [Acetivibrio alkalicellulosi]